jgi:glucose-1-phosphate thymidylyltransferase
VGTRLRPHTHTLPKVLVHVAGKPILGHILDELKDIGVTELILVVGYMGDMVIDYVKKNYDFEVNFVKQDELLGLGHAILLTQPLVKGQPVLIVLGDTIFKADFSKTFSGECDYIGVKEVADPRRFGVVELSEDRISRFVEKPQDPPSNQAIVGLYYIRNSSLMFECLKALYEKGRKTAGEYQLTDALQDMLERGEKMRTFLVDGWYDCGKPETLLDTNRRLLSEEAHCPERLKKNNIIHEPVFIAESAEVDNSIIGPYVSIADGVQIKRSMISNCIINKGAVVEDILLEESLIGTQAEVNGMSLRLNVGDSSQVEIS